MVLFTIACDTCASRLQVKQQAAIGQVLACPKCGSMVHVQPPQGWEMPTSPGTPPKRTRPAYDPNDSQATLSGEFGSMGSQAPTIRPRPTEPRASKRPASVSIAAPPVQETMQVVPANHWEADGSAQRGKTRAWLAGVLGICLISLVLILYMVSRMMGGGAETDPAQLAGMAETASQGPELNVAPGSGKQPAAEGDQILPDVNLPGPDGDPTDAQSGDPPSPPDTTNNDDSGRANAPPKDDDPSDATDPAAANDPAAGSDPILDEEAALSTAGETITMQGEQEKRSLLDEFEGISDLVFDPGVDMQEFREATSEDPTHKYGIGKVYVPVPKTLSVIPSEAIEEVYPGLSFRDQPLVDFMRNFFAITQVPMQLDGDAIAHGQLDATAPVTAQGRDVTPAGILDEALTPLGLTWNWNADQTVILILPRVSDEIEASEITLDPVLAVTDEDVAEKLIAGIQLVIAPLSWNTNGGSGSIRYSPGQLSLEQTASIKDRVQRLLDKLVLAAQLKANPGDPALQESLATLHARTRSIRESASKVYAMQNQPLQQLLYQLREQDGINLVVNWSEALQENWNPNVTIPWLSKDLTVEDTLRDLLNSMALAYRLLDGNTLEITSKRKLWSETRLEVYPCHRQLEKKFTGDQIMEFLKEGIAADLPANVHTQVVYSPTYECVVAVLPDPLHVRVEKILQQLAERK